MDKTIVTVSTMGIMPNKSLKLLNPCPALIF